MQGEGLHVGVVVLSSLGHAPSMEHGDHIEEGWFIPNGKKLDSEQLFFFKDFLLNYGTLVTETLYLRDKYDGVWILKAGEDFEDQGRIMVVLRETPDMLRVVCERDMSSPMYVGQREVIKESEYKILKNMTTTRRKSGFTPYRCS
jgi:hypothetical protein